MEQDRYHPQRTKLKIKKNSINLYNYHNIQTKQNLYLEGNEYNMNGRLRQKKTKNERKDKGWTDNNETHNQTTLAA